MRFHLEILSSYRLNNFLFSLIYLCLYLFLFSYGLSYEEIEKGLPRIDTSRTLIREVCPAFLANVECQPGKYRRYDGLCNNVKHPTWGATNTPFTRYLNLAPYLRICIHFGGKMYN